MMSRRSRLQQDNLNVIHNPTVQTQNSLANREKCKRYREQLKADPIKYAEHKAAERQRSKLYRNTLTSDKKEKQRTLTRLRLKAFRVRQKAKQSSLSTAESFPCQQPKTRTDVMKLKQRRENNRISQQKRRENMTSQKKRREREKALAYYHKKKALKQATLLVKEKKKLHEIKFKMLLSTEKRRTFANAFDLQTANLHLSEDSTPYCAKVIHPGVTPETTDVYGHPELTSIVKAISLARTFAFHVPADESDRTFLGFDQLTKDFFTFVSSSLINIPCHMYDPTIPKWPLEIKVQGGHIGRTSLSTVTSVTSTLDPERRELMTQINKVVQVDKITRRPVPLEEKWRQLYETHCVRGEPLIIQRQDAPDSGPLSTYEVKLAWRDIDNYQHANFASYVGFAVDAVHDALRQGRLDGFLSEEDFSSGVSQVKIAYLGESVEGDTLKVEVWCPQDCARTVVCSMQKEGKVINQITLTFHSQINDLMPKQ